MTSRELAGLIRRRWYLVLIGLVAALAILWPITHRPGVYWSQVQVVLLPPTFERFPNQYEDPQYSLSALAGVIVTDFNGGDTPLQTASSDTTLYGEGVRNGTLVRMLNLGTQWNPQYDLPRIDVQAVGDDPAAVTEQVHQITAKLADLLAQRQQALNIDPNMKASMAISPTEPSVYYITGSRTRALAAGSVVGLVLTVASIYAIEKLSIRRRSMRRDVAGTPRAALRPARLPPRQSTRGPAVPPRERQPIDSVTLN